MPTPSPAQMTLLLSWSTTTVITLWWPQPVSSIPILVTPSRSPCWLTTLASTLAHAFATVEEPTRMSSRTADWHRWHIDQAIWSSRILVSLALGSSAQVTASVTTPCSSQDTLLGA